MEHYTGRYYHCYQYSLLSVVNYSFFVIGLKADLQHPSTNWKLGPTTDNISSWKQRWVNLPIIDKIFIASSTTSRESIKPLLRSIESECDRIFNSFTVQIPISYRAVLYDIRTQQWDKTLIPLHEVFLQCSCGTDEVTFSRIVRYLHAIGRIALLKDDFVCADPTVIPKIAAKFISPDQVRLYLLNFDVPVLTIAEIGCLMDIDTTNNNR